ncbi:UNVERIFIED_CONTAM: hypothetical protein FKN15_033724 [Acipenser sinensis]
MLSLVASEEVGEQEVGEQELPFLSEDMESDSTSPEIKLSLSAEHLPLIKRATAVLQVPWPTEAPAVSWSMGTLYRMHDAEKLGLAQFPLVEASIAALVLTPNLARLSNDTICPNQECRVSEVILNVPGKMIQHNKAEFLDFVHKGDSCRVDEFLGRFVSGRAEYENLWDLLKCLFTLSHGQAAVERGYCVNKDMLVENLKERTLISLCLVQDSLAGRPMEDAIPKALVQHAKTARMRYVQYLENEKKKKVATENDRKRKELMSDIAHQTAKRQKIINSIEVMQREADEMAENAEKQQDFTRISKSNAYRKSVTEKSSEMTALDQSLAQLRESETIEVKRLKGFNIYIEPPLPEPRGEEPPLPEPRGEEPPLPEPRGEEPPLPEPRGEEPPLPEPRGEEPPLPEPRGEEPPLPEPRGEEPPLPEPRGEEPPLPEPRGEEPPLPEPRGEEPPLPEPRGEEPPLPEPRGEEPPLPEPRGEEPPLPEPRGEEPSLPEPRGEEPPLPEPRKEVKKIPPPQPRPPPLKTSPAPDGAVPCPDVVDYAEKEKAIAKALEDLRANFYCELCDKQYQKHQEFDNHINSYDHAHKQTQNLNKDLSKLLAEPVMQSWPAPEGIKVLRSQISASFFLSRTELESLVQYLPTQYRTVLFLTRYRTDLVSTRSYTARYQQVLTSLVCAPGSGPMFKATTVAVDEESSEDGSLYPDGTPVLAGVSEGMPAEEKGTPSCGHIVSLASPKQAATATVSVPPVKNNSTPQPKVGFSFSFAKKVPVKLETTASVFKELGEEVLTDESQKEEEEKTGCDPLVPPKLPDGESPLSIQAKAVSAGEEEQQDSEGGALASTLSKLKVMMKREEGSSHQEPQYYHYIPPAHCSVKPNFQFLLFMRASDQSSYGKESEESSRCPQDARERDSSKQGEGRPGDSKLKETLQGDGKQTDCKHKQEQHSQNQQRAAAAEPGSNMVKVKEKMGSPKVTASEKQPVECSKAIAEPNDGPRQPTGPFFPVLSKDESTTLQWPSELLEFTRAQPSLSYSCNPLYFDFKLSRNKDGRGKLATDKSGSVRTGEQQAASQKVRLEAEKPTGNIGEGTGNKPEQTAAASGDGQTEPASTSPAPKKDKTLKAHKQKKKKKKHKKSSKRAKLKERGSGAGECEGAPDEKSKKRKKQKRKKSKSRASEEREDQVLQAAEEFSEGGKRKRPIQDNHQRTAAEESIRGSQAKSSEPTSSSEEYNGAKRHKSEPVAVASSLRKQSSSRGRRSQSQHGSSEEDESEDGDSSHRKSSSSRTQRQHRHYSEEDSERSLSRSSRRGGHRHSRRASSHSRSDSSSSGHSSERSSRYSGRRGRSSSDSYSDYSECSRQGRRSKHSPTSDSDYDCSRRSGRHSHRRQYTSSESSCSRSNSRDRGSRRRRSHHRSSCSSSRSRSPSWKRSRSSYSRSSGSQSRRSSSSTKGSSRGGNRHHESSSERRRRRNFNRSKIYRSQSPRSSSRTPARREETRTSSSSSTSLQRTGAARGGAASIHPEPSIVEERNSLTARQLLEKVQARKGPEDGPTASGKAGIKLKDPPQGYFGPKLPPSLGNKAVLPLFGKLPVVKKPLMRRPDELGSERAEEMEILEAGLTAGEVVVVEPIREFPPPPPPLPPPQLGENRQAPHEEMPAEASTCLFEPEPGFLVQPYPSEPCQDAAKGLTALEPFPPELQPFPGYTSQPLEEDEPEAEEDSSLAPLESQPITFTPEEMEKYSKLQQAAQQHIQQQLLAKQVKSFPAAANLAPAPALQPIHIQQSAAATATATSITTVQHAILQHHAAAAAAAIGLHPHPHHHHPQQLAQVHHIPQHHLTPFSLSPLGHSLIPAHHAAFLSSHPIHIIPASAIHHTQLALHHVPHAALYPTLFAPRPTTATAALHLHPFLHPIFSGQDLQHPPNHGS